LRTRYAISGRLKLAITIAALVAALCVAAWDQWQSNAKQEAPQNTTLQGAPDRQRYHQKEFYVTKATDGDTIHIDALDGNHLTTTVRLIGVDTPETKKPNTPVMYYGPEASAFTKELVTNKKVEIWLDTISPERDKYGRLLAYVKLPDGRVLNEVLIAEGYGYADTRFRHGFSEKYSQLEASARRAQKGLWAGVTEDQKPQWMQKRDSKKK
jgi:endonuclease YncB( thermonuclease family)